MPIKVHPKILLRLLNTFQPLQNVIRPSDTVRKKMENYAENTPDYAEISKVNKVAPLAFLNV